MNTQPKSVKKNFAWSFILTITGYIFPLLTFPYVSRVFGVDGIGNYQYADSITQYFTMFAMLGIATVGIREIAKVRNNKEEMSKVFSSLITLNLSTTLISIIIFAILIHIIPTFISHKSLLYIGISRILCGALVVEWFYKGLENFQYITVRAIIVRCLYVCSVFIFVRDVNDVAVYFLLTVSITIVNAIINIWYSRNFVSFSLHDINVKRFLKPYLTLGLYQFLTSMYMSFNVMYLGMTSGDTQVGYYSTATKLYGIIISIFTAFTGVMLPRMSSLVAEGKKNEFLSMTSKSIDFLLVFSLPLIIISELYTPQIIGIISGQGFEGAIIPMRIVMPLMLIIGYEQIIIIQMLSPLRKDNAILTNSFVGGTVALILNFTLIPIFGAIGSSMVWCFSEISVLISAQYFVSKYTGFKFPVIKIFKNIIVIAPAIIVGIVIDHFIGNQYISMVIGIVCIFAYTFFIDIYILKNQVLLGTLNSLRVIINKNLIIFQTNHRHQ